MKLLNKRSSILLATTFLFGQITSSHAASSIFTSTKPYISYSNITESDIPEDKNLRLERQNYDLIRVNISDSVAFDEAVVYFTNGATDGFDSDYDAHKIASGGLNISTYSNSDLAKEDMAINGIEDHTHIYLPFKISTRKPNSYKLTIKEYVNSKGRSLYLYDKAANKYSLITPGATYTLSNISGVSSGQFFITSTIAAEIVTGIADEQLNTCGISFMPNPYNSGPLLLQLTGFGSGPSNIEIADTKGTILKLINLDLSENMSVRNIENYLSNLETGTYIVKLKSLSAYAINKLVILK